MSSKAWKWSHGKNAAIAACPFLLWIALAADTPPQKLCEFDGFATPRLARVAARTSVNAYFGCSATARCLATTIRPGDPLEVYGTEGDWTCGYHQDNRGAAPVWVRSSALQPIDADTKPPLDAWTGAWRQGENSITIRRSGAALQLSGNAVWHGRGDNVHTGDFSGQATPSGNRIHYVEGDCAIDFALIGRYLVLDDNSACGGVNVRFWGIWTRR